MREPRGAHPDLVPRPYIGEMDVAENDPLNPLGRQGLERLAKRGLEPRPGRPPLDERHADGFGLRGDELRPCRVEPDAAGCLVVEVHEAGGLVARAARTIRREGAVLSPRPHDGAAHQGAGTTTGRPSCRPTERPVPNTSRTS